MTRARLLWLAMCVLSLCACVRLGYSERFKPAADGGKTGPVDAATSDASSRSDAGGQRDSGSPRDASDDADATTQSDASMEDASTKSDANLTTSDASAEKDASKPAPDASMANDAAMEPDAGPTCMPVMRDYCTKLPALPEAPELDGVLDCGPALIALPASGWNSTGVLPSDNEARYAVAWRPDGLYFYVEVDDMLRLPALASDVDPWCGDGVELYADADGVYVSAPDYDDPGAMQLLAVAPARDSSTPLAVDALYHTRNEQRAGDWSTSRHITVARDNGYALEAFVAAADLELATWSLAAGAKVGFDIAINVSVTDESEKVACGYNLGQYYLRLSRAPCSNDNCRPYSNAAAFCTAVLE